MGSPRLATPDLQVVMRDGSEHRVQALNVDLLAWERDRAKHNWPQPQDSPFIWLNYLAWHALTKTQGLLPQMTLRQFEEAAAMVASATDDEGEEAGVDPTQSEADIE